jgi:type I restriction enzyme S subunit
MVGASVGNRGIIYPCHLPALRNQNMWCFRAIVSSIVTQPFAKYLLDILVSKSGGLASGSAMEFFRKGDFGDQKICIGTALIQDAFFQYAMPLLEEMAALTAENQNLELLRDTLLPKLLSGEIDLREAI